MLLKILLKIWPALLPIFLYFLWNYLLKKIIAKIFGKKQYIDAKYQDLDDKSKSKQEISPYSFQNKQFIFVIYLSLIFLIISFLSFAIN